MYEAAAALGLPYLDAHTLPLFSGTSFSIYQILTILKRGRVGPSRYGVQKGFWI